MKKLSIKLFFSAVVIAMLFPSLASAQNLYSYLGAWQPPSIGQSNYSYSKTAPFTGASTGKITTIQWQLMWNPTPPTNLKMKICNAANSICVTITNPAINGNTAAFAGESPNQTFLFYFSITTSPTVVYSPPYAGVASNSWLQANYTN